MEAKTQPDLDGRIAELKTQRDSLEAFRADVKDADKTELKAMFGGLMSEDRSHRALDGSVSMLVTLTDDGEIDAAHFVTVRRGGYVKPSIARKYDAHLSTGTGAFVSYQNLRQAVLSDLAQALEGVNDNIRALK